jgi:hypothetical protein
VDLAKLNTGELVQLLDDNRPVQFAPGRWSLIGEPLGARLRRQVIRWVPVRRIAQRYSVAEVA